VVVLIVATLAGISIYAIEQVFNRRLSRQADDIRSWLNDLADRSMLEGAAYGVRAIDGRLQAMVFFRYHWLNTDDPEAFVPGDDLVLRWLVEDKPPPEPPDALDGREPLLPLVAVMPSGEFIPEGRLEIFTEDSDADYHLSWGHDQPGISIEKVPRR